jgi:type I restriction enzyme S subunit
MKGYPTYKDSGVAWLGDVPEHWEVKRTKYILRETDKRSSTGSEQLLSVSQYTGVTPRKKRGNTELVDTRANSLVGYKAVEKNDLVVNIMLAWNGSLGVSQYSGIVSPAYCIYRFTKKIHPLFFHYLYKTDIYKSTFKTYSTGVVESRLRLYTDKLGRIESLLPPLAEQQQIARYLDWQTTQINKFIKAKKRLIALLKEQKQNIINQAVTKGINPDVTMKDSGVEWLGEIPAHWEAIRLKRCTSSIDQGWSPQCEAQQTGKNEWGVLKVGCVNGDHFNARQNKKLPDVLSPRLQCKIQLNDIIVSRANTRDLVGLAALVENDYPNILLCDKLFRFRSRDNIAISKFLVYCIRSSTSREQIEERATGASSSMQNISQSVIRNLCIALPPLNEQLFIVDHIVQESTLIDQTIIRTEREIELIQEYRTRLVSDVVTGKIDVRSVAIPEFEPAETDPNARNDKEPEDELVSLEEAA